MENAKYTAVPWHLNGEGFILNYWISPQFTHQYSTMGILPTAIGRLVQVILVRYHNSPVGPYDELLVLDHPLKNINHLSTIPKIYVSSQRSIDEGRHHWGIPKELAQFEWRRHHHQLFCYISHQDQELSLHLKFSKNNFSRAISSKFIPDTLLNIRQYHDHVQYDFQPQFCGTLGFISHAHWKNTHDIFPDFSKACFLKGVYMPNFELIFPEAIKKYRIK